MMKLHLFGRKAKAQFDCDGLGLRSWFTHNLSEDIYIVLLMLVLLDCLSLMI